VRSRRHFHRAVSDVCSQLTEGNRDKSLHSLLHMNLAGQNYSLYSRTGLSVEADICVLLCAVKSGDFRKDTPVSRTSASYIFRTSKENGTHFLSFILFIYFSV